MTDLRHERRHLGHGIYKLPITAERKHTDQLHHGEADVFVLLGFFRCVSTFRFSCVFLTENLLAMNFRRSNISYIGGVAASRFSDIPYSAPSASKPPLRMKKLLGEKAQTCYAGYPCFLNTFVPYSAT